MHERREKIQMKGEKMQITVMQNEEYSKHMRGKGTTYLIQMEYKVIKRENERELKKYKEAEERGRELRGDR